MSDLKFCYGILNNNERCDKILQFNDCFYCNEHLYQRNKEKFFDLIGKKIINEQSHGKDIKERLKLAIELYEFFAYNKKFINSSSEKFVNIVNNKIEVLGKEYPELLKFRGIFKFGSSDENIVSNDENIVSNDDVIEI
jgi:hypothetical protein